MGNFEDEHFSQRVSDSYNAPGMKIIIIEYDGPTESDYRYIGNAQAKAFAAELRDLYTRYQYSTVGDMECSGMLTAGEDILSALSKIELFKQSL